MTRYVHKDRRVYHDAHCLLCGACSGICKGEHRVCRRAICHACGSAQCSINGLSRGQCGICHIGLLSGWSGSDSHLCDYKGCTDRAIVRVDGANNYRCRRHVERGKWAGYLNSRLAAREREFVEVEDTPTAFPVL